MRQIDTILNQLTAANEGGGSAKSRLRIWSRFVMQRDDHRCVVCGRKNGLNAHHICRKSFFPESQFLPGNGITLCRGCHKDAHKGFNGKPDMQLPMDTQGGEKIEILAELYGVLLDDAMAREMPLNAYYYLSESVLSKYNWFQGFDHDVRLSEFHLEHAFLVWRHAPQQMMKAVFEANGFHFPQNTALKGDQLFIGFENGTSVVVGE